MRKLVCLILVTSLLMSVTVYGKDITTPNHAVHEGDCCDVLSEGDLKEPDGEKGTCYLGHWFTAIKRISRATDCKEFGDLVCKFKCYEITYCTNCNYEISRTLVHTHNSCHRYNGLSIMCYNSF